MPDIAPSLRTLKVPQVTSDDNPYHLLVSAIVARAVADATGEVFAPSPQSPAEVQEAARQWLGEEAAVAALIELTGFDADPVLRRIRRVLQAPVPVVAESQLVLF